MTFSSLGRRSAMLEVQKIIFQNQLTLDVTRHMYCRVDFPLIANSDGGVILEKDVIYDFLTYFNSFSIMKWKKYSNANNYYLVLDFKGSIIVDIQGIDGEENDYQKKWLAKRRKIESLTERKKVVIKIEDDDCVVCSFLLKAVDGSILYDAYYAVDIDESDIKKPFISMVTTTFKKEDYVKRNIKLLEKNLFKDEKYKDSFNWSIVDNGRTLDESIISCKQIRLFPNKNVGGAGGFARGMMEALSDGSNPTHILLMDDDVLFSPESFKRLRNLLMCLKDEYGDYFVSGAMLKMRYPNIQHEDIGVLIEEGYHRAAKPNYDLNNVIDFIKNEEFETDEEHVYAAWWFCCIPTSVANLNNLPVPVFVRGDDVEYSLRNKAKFITMNGLCIWHEGFEGKFSASMEFYQVCRNELAVTAMHAELSDIDVLGHIKMLFWEEIYKFNYKGASLLLDALEDFMKGPELFKKLDGEKSMKDKKNADNSLEPITDEIRKNINYDRLFDGGMIESKIGKYIYDYSYNGQARVPEFLTGNKIGSIPYGFGYFPKNMRGAKRIIAVDLNSDKYVIYERSRKKFRELKKRYNNLINDYEGNKENLLEMYKKHFDELSSNTFWKSYLYI